MLQPRFRRPPKFRFPVLAVVASLVIIGLAFAYYRVMESRSRDEKSVSCLKSIATAMMLYGGVANATQAATAPAMQATGDPREMWNLLRASGEVILMRHAATPSGSGEPANFDLADRATQRNLSDAGREQARQIGLAFGREKIPLGDVDSSQYFRCQDTATLAFGHVNPVPALNGLSDNPAKAREQLAALRRLIVPPPAGKNLVLVTHQTNIIALTGIRPDPGECVILTPTGDGQFRIAGRLHADKN